MKQLQRFSKKARLNWHQVTPNMDAIEVVLLGFHYSQLKWLDETPGGRYYYELKWSPLIQNLWFERLEDKVLYQLTWG
jgi:hypothetical protein